MERAHSAQKTWEENLSNINVNTASYMAQADAIQWERNLNTKTQADKSELEEVVILSYFVAKSSIC